MYFSAVYTVCWYRKAFLRWRRQTRVGWETRYFAYFRAKCVNIAKTVGSCIIMSFRLTPRSMTFDDLERSNFRRISQIWEATTAKRMIVRDIVLSETASWQTECTFQHRVATCLRWFAVDFFARGLHTRTAVAHLPSVRFLPRDALYVQSAVLRSHVVCPSVCPSVCDVGELWSHRLEIFENNFTFT